MEAWGMISEYHSGIYSNVVVHGLDIVDVVHFTRLMNKHAGDFMDRYFTLGELLAASDGGNRFERLASRFAIKEAVLKALGTGWGGGIAFTDVEVVSEPLGAPTIVLHRKLVLIAQDRGIVRWLVSASHTAVIAMASVIGLGSQSGSVVGFEKILDK
jgi:holo-[acyl-carrier protein] synthase